MYKNVAKSLLATICYKSPCFANRLFTSEPYDGTNACNHSSVAMQPNRIKQEITMNKTFATMISLSLLTLTMQSALADPVKARERHRLEHRHETGAEHRAHMKNRDPRVNQHQSNQRDRIAQGVRSGELTRGETRQLAQEQRAIRQKERLYKSDGVLTRDERKDLHLDQKAASKDIYNEKHDAEKR